MEGFRELLSAGFGKIRRADESLFVRVAPPPPPVAALGVGEASRCRVFDEAEALTEAPSAYLACCLINLFGF